MTAEKTPHSGSAGSAAWLGRDTVIAMLLIVASGLLGTFAGERIPVNGGLGWDGKDYAEIARSAPDLSAAAVSAYRLQRSLPSLVVGLLLSTLGIPPSDEALATAFSLLNTLLLGVTCMSWGRIARTLALSRSGFWLGITGLFVNFAALRQATYTPVLVDSSALLIGTLQLQLALEHRWRPLALVTFCGAFTWQLAAPAGLFLLLFPRGVIAPRSSRTVWSTAAALLVVGVYLLRFARLQAGGIDVIGGGPVVPIVRPWLAISLLVCIGYLLSLVRGALRGYEPRDIIVALRALRSPRIALAAVAVLLPALAIRLVRSDGGPADEISAAGFSSFLTILPVVRPATFLVAHFAYFGPIVLLAIGAWPSVAAVVRRAGLGIVLVFLMGGTIALSSESRQSTLFLPLIVAFTALALDERGLARALAPATLVLAIAGSRFWIALNTVTAEHLPPRGLTVEEMARYFPRFLGNHGPWMTDRWYLIHLSAATASGAILWIIARRASGAERRLRPIPRGTVQADIAAPSH